MNLKKVIYLALVIVLIWSFDYVYAENIDPCDNDSQYAYGENIGWVNFEPNRPEPNVGGTVTDHNVGGFIWSENIGWINLWPKFGGITNDGDGRLSGYAWSENVGWINFEPNVPNDVNCYGVTINSEGKFDGWAWGENIGWIHLKSSVPVAYNVQASWRGSEILGTCWDPCKCAGQTSGDASCDGCVCLDDLAALKAAWGMSAPYANPYCCADFTQDGQVNLDDLAALKAGWGGYYHIPSTGSQSCPP